MQQATHYEPDSGTHIEHACKEATALAIKAGHVIPFKFNDIALTASPQTSWKKLAEKFHSDCEKRRTEYEQSPEGIEAAENRKSEIAIKQQTVSNLIATLPTTLKEGSLDDVIDWLKRFTNPSDDIGVRFDKQKVSEIFEFHGYMENEGVGEKPDWFNTRERMGRYIIGQAINCLKSGMPPHGITLSFIEKYEKLK